MDELKQEKIFPRVGNITTKRGPNVSTFGHSSPWKQANTSFYWVNFEYPLYHGHMDWEIQIVLNDCIVHKINNTEQLLPAGTACLIGPKDRHAIFYPDGVKNQYQGVILLARDSYIKSLLDLYSPTLYDELCNTSSPLYFMLSPTSLEKYTSLLLSIQTFENESTPYTEQECNIIFSNILLKFLEQRESSYRLPPILQSFVQLLNNPSITNEEIKAAEQALPYSYPQLSRLFKKYLHCTITQYVNKSKLQYAKEWLINTNLPLTEIVEQLHFESISYFHKLFKSYFHTTPLQYRKMNSMQSTSDL